jgi:hypothetical protein
MPGVNQFLPFATGASANVLAPAVYASLPVISTGFVDGIAVTEQLNTVWRQSSFIAAAVAQIVANGGLDALDDGDVNGFVGNLLTALSSQLSLTLSPSIVSNLLTIIQTASSVTAGDVGSVNAYAMNLQPAISTYTPGMVVSIQNINATNTGASTLSINGLAALPIYGPAATALQGGELVAGYGAILRVNAAANAFELVATTGGSLPVAPATQSGQAVNLGQLGNYNKVIVGFATGTLPSTCWGGAVQIQGGATVTLPIANPVAGSKVVLYGQSGSFTAVSHSDQFIYSPSIGLTSTTGPTTVSIPDSGWIELTSRGSGEYDVTGGSPLVFQNTVPAFVNPLAVPNAIASNQAVNLGQLINPALSVNFSGLAVTQNITSLPADYDTHRVDLLRTTTPTVGVSFGSNDSRILTAGIGPNGSFIRGAGNLDLSFNGGVLVPNATVSNQAVNLGQFSANSAAYGWRKVPSANSPTGYFIEQWGKSGDGTTPQTSGSSTAVVFNFPIAFPNACRSILANDISSACHTVAINAASTTQAQAWGWSGSAYASTNFAWFAIGY